MSHSADFPRGQEQVAQINGRHRRGTIWRLLFAASTIVGILALMALLYNIINETFGLVAVQSKIEPKSLVLDTLETRLINTANTITSEDDTVLAQQIAADPNAIGFFGYAYYQENADSLRALSINGVAPTAETAVSGDYPVARPLYLYTTAEVLQQNQAANIFINYYLSHVDKEIESVGYFPADATALTSGKFAYIAASGLDLQPGQWAVLNPANITGNVNIAGSSTVFPLTQRMADLIAESGFQGNIQTQSTGTTAGIRAFCEGSSVDIVNASRPITPGEYETCLDNGRTPIELQVGTDALAIVVSQQNSFLNDVSTDQLNQIFTTATAWADVNGDWPSQPINRTIPGADSGTLDFFTESLLATPLRDMPKDDLVRILAQNISLGRGRSLEREQKFYSSKLVFEDPALWNEVCAAADRPDGCTMEPRSEQNIYSLIVREIVQPDVRETWSLFDSIFHRAAIAQTAAEKYPNASLEFRSWLTPEFIVSPQSSTPEYAGVRTAILGSLWVVAITILFSFPVGVGAAIYLEEYATDSWFNRIIQTNINNLAGVPSIIYGLLGLTVFVRLLEVLTSGALLGAVQDATTANGRTILSAGLTLGLLILPVVIIASQEAIRAVPNSMRQAGMALGATKWQTIWAHVIPSALPGILTGTILAIARAIGETAPLVVVGASTFIVVDPDGPFSKFTVLPIQIYQWTSRPQAEFRNIAAAAIVVLLVLLLSLNATAVMLRNRFARRV